MPHRLRTVVSLLTPSLSPRFCEILSFFSMQYIMTVSCQHPSPWLLSLFALFFHMWTQENLLQPALPFPFHALAHTNIYCGLNAGLGEKGPEREWETDFPFRGPQYSCCYALGNTGFHIIPNTSFLGFFMLLNLFSRIWEMGKLSATGVSLSCTNGLHCLGEVTSLGAEGFVWMNSLIFEILLKNKKKNKTEKRS